MFPILDLAGEPFARGLAHGRAARAQVTGSVRCYAALFASCGISWKEAQARAAEFREIIAGCGGGMMEEIEGIATGSGFKVDEILALNCRTEILPPSFMGTQDADSEAARKKNAAMGLFDIGECTSVAVAGSRCIDGHTRVAQNWDWIGFQRQNVVILRVQREGWPSFLTITEAGILAKIGVNEHGLAIGLNILRATNDRQTLGIPVHIFQRMALDYTNVASLVALAQQMKFAASSNAILGDATGAVTSLEYSPNGSSAMPPTRGVIAHTNHFQDFELHVFQAPLTQMLTTEPRLQCAEAWIKRWPQQIDDGHLISMLRDESGDNTADARGRFGAICRSPDPALPAEQRVESVLGVVIDCNARKMLVAAGLPSRVEFESVAL